MLINWRVFILTQLFCSFLPLFQFSQDLSLIKNVWSADETGKRIKYLSGTYKTKKLTLHNSDKQRKLIIHLHFPLDKLAFAKQVEEVIKTDFPLIVRYFDYVPPSPLHVVVQEFSEEANGAATVFPDNYIFLNDFPPLGRESLNGSRDWVRVLVLHEFVHVLTMDQTSGVLSYLRKIFGSAVKFGGVVPRWFAEGLAVWAESEFTQEGRLKWPELEDDFLSRFADQNYCQSIDCLDDPGTFPYGSNPYWAGSFFLRYIESKKPGTLRCLVKNNSYYIPFFLNSSFEYCTGKKAQTHFYDFLKDVEKKKKDKAALAQKTIQALSLRPLLVEKEQVLDWTKGAVLEENTFSYITIHQQRRVQRLVTNDLKHGTQKFSFLPEQIEQIFSDKSKTSTSMVLTTIRPSSQKLLRHHWLLPIEKEGAPQELTRVDDVYLFGQESPLSLRYAHSRWELRKDEQTLYSFPPMLNIYSPMWIPEGDSGWLLFLSNDKGENYSVMSLEDSGGIWTLKSVYQGKYPLELWGQCESQFIVYEAGPEKSLVSLSTSQSSTGVRVKQGKLNLPVVPLYVQLGKNFSALKIPGTGGRPYIYAGSCKKLLSQMIPVSINKDQQTSIKSEENNLLKTEGAQDGELQSYIPLRYFTPNYLLLTYTFDGGLGGLRARTSLHDPLDRHEFKASGTYYSELGEVVPQLSYSYQRRYFQFKGAYEQKRFRNTDNFTLNEVESSSVLLGAILPFKKLDWVFGPLLAKETRKDFVSTRKSHKAGVFQSFSYVAPFEDNLLQLLFGHSQIQRQKTRTHASFWDFETKIILGLRPSLRHDLKFTTTYGRLFKDNLSSGSLFGGGSSDDPILGESYHEFYGVLSGDLYGNYIVTAHGQYAYEWGRHYSGPGFFPVYLKESSLLAGVDWAQSDYLVVGSEVRRGAKLTSVHLGGRLGLNVFYRVPLNLDIVLAKVLSRVPKNRWGPVMVLSLPIF